MNGIEKLTLMYNAASNEQKKLIDIQLREMNWSSNMFSIPKNKYESTTNYENLFLKYEKSSKKVTKPQYLKEIEEKELITNKLNKNKAINYRKINPQELILDQRNIQNKNSSVLEIRNKNQKINTTFTNKTNKKFNSIGVQLDNTITSNKSILPIFSNIYKCQSF